MRNNIKSKILLLIIGVVFVSSCQNESVEPVGNTTKTYGDSIAARAAVNELYTKGLSQLYLSTDQDNGIPLAWGSYLSGLFESEATQGYYPALTMQNMTAPSIKDLAKQIYSACFDGIEAADTIIQQIPNTLGLNPAEQARLIGEAKFFRSFNRFYLIRVFGAFPDKRTDSSYLSMEASYAKVEKDLLEAIATLPDKSFVENKLHVTSLVARALLGDVYLHMSGRPLQKNKYVQAAEILRPIIKSGKHQLASNGVREDQSAFNILRTTPTNDEYLYVIYGENTLSRASFAFPKIAKNWDNVKEHVAFNAFRPTRTLLACYGDEDLRGKNH